MDNNDRAGFEQVALGIGGLTLVGVLLWLGRRLRAGLPPTQPPLQPAVPPLCYEVRAYRVFIPTPQEICPDIPEMMASFRHHKQRFNAIHRRQPAAVLERAFLEEFAWGCHEIWAEQWTTVVCDNQHGACEIDDPGIWQCDHPDIPPGVLVEDWDYPYYLLSQMRMPCGSAGCLEGDDGIPDGDMELPGGDGNGLSPA